MIIRDGSKNSAEVEDGCLKVCLCDIACDGHISMKDLGKVYPDVRVLIHVKNGKGEIVPLGGDE